MNNGKVLLVNPWIVDFAAYDFWIKPIGLLIVGSVLKENGYAVSLLDCMDRYNPSLIQLRNSHRIKQRNDGRGHFYKEFIPKPAILKTVPRRFGRYGLPLILVKKKLKQLPTPDIIFVTSGMTYWYPGVVEMISLLKDVFKNIPVVLGGIYATLLPEHARTYSGADYIVEGEGIVEGLEIAGEITGNHSDIKRYQFFNDYPGPLYDCYTHLHSAALLTSRGCPFQCPFCASRLLSKTYQRRNPSILIEEIENLSRTKKVSEFAFYDDALLFDKENHIVPFLETLIERGIQVHFHTPNGLQPGEINQRLAGLMKKSGFRTIRLSYETKNEALQADMGFKVKNEDLISAVHYLVQAGFSRTDISSYVLMGLPGQKLGDVIESILFVFNLKIKVKLASFSPIPGTKSWRDAADLGILSDHIDPLLTNSTVFPLMSKTVHYENSIRLRTLVNLANNILDRGGDSIHHSDFINALHLIEASMPDNLSKV